MNKTSEEHKIGFLIFINLAAGTLYLYLKHEYSAHLWPFHQRLEYICKRLEYKKNTVIILLKKRWVSTSQNIILNGIDLITTPTPIIFSAYSQNLKLGTE